MDKKKQKKPERGIETMFRVASANQQRLSEMADNKAHIMITVNAIILSVIISVLLGRIEAYSQLISPTIVLLIINVMTLVFAVLATRPSVSQGIQVNEKAAIKKSNMLYFGNFIALTEEEYTSHMFEIMSSYESIYKNLTRDIHAQGIVLNKKYKLLRLSYNIFMYGIIASVFGFVIAIFW
jgi:hypothetical protein